MSKTIKVYCEGTKESWDKLILEKIFKEIDKSPLIEPLGGKKGVGSLIPFDFEKVTKPSFYFFFRDRDFDYKVPTKEELILVSKKDTHSNEVGQWCISYRTTIENYLFHPKTLFEFLENKKLLTKNRIANEEDAKNTMIKAAKEIADYQAVRHTLGALRENLDLGSSFLKNGSGNLPTDLSLAFCKEEALKKINTLKNKTENWNQFDIKLQEFINVFKEKDFYTNLQFLVWFQGKDFAAALTRLINGFSANDYYSFAIKRFDYLQFPDLVQLKDIIKSKANE